MDGKLLREAGRALDVQVETTVFGSTIQDHPFGPRRWREEYGVKGWDDVPRYSTRIEDAWRIVEHFWAVAIDACADVSPPYTVTITSRNLAHTWQAKADTAALAICRAALLAVEETGSAKQQ